MSGSEWETTRSGATPLADLRLAVAACLDVLVDDLGQQVDGLAHRRCVDVDRLGQQGQARRHQLAQVRLAGGRVLPVDVGLGAAERLGLRAHALAEPLASGPHDLAHEAPDELVGVGHGPRPVHRGGVDDGGELALEDAGLHRLGDRLGEELAVGVVEDHAGPHEAERRRPDPAELVVDAHGRLPVGVHPGAPGGLGVRRAVVGGAQHGPHHHRRRDRGAAHPLGVQVGEVVVGDDLVAVVGQALVERALRHQVPSHHPRLKEGALRFNPTEHTDLREGELRRCNSTPSCSRSRAPGPTFCSLT